MKNVLFTLFFLIIGFNSYSQILFEKGYYIDKGGQTVDCLIKNRDWKDNPVSFEYKISENSEVERKYTKTIMGFGISNASKFELHIVDIDRSSDLLDKLSIEREPIFKKEELLLRVLIEGKASLYSYRENNLIRYFYKFNDEDVKQLVYKRFEKDGLTYGVNNDYKKQLFNDLKCDKTELIQIREVEYKKKDLLKLIMAYNECVQSDYDLFQKKRNKDIFNLSIRPGYRKSSLKLKNSESPDFNTDFGSKTGIRIGLEAELILPFHKNKWSVFVEPTYQSFESERETAYINNNWITKKAIFKAEYKSVEVPIGIRHYMFVNNNIKLFINAAYVLDFEQSSSQIYAENRSTLDLKVSTDPNFALGAGINFMDKFSAEARVNIKRQITADYVFWSTEYTGFSLILGYNIF